MKPSTRKYLAALAIACVWWNTKNDSCLNMAPLDLAHSLPWKVELRALEHSANRTLVIVRRPYPYSVLYPLGSAWYLVTSLLLIVLAIYLLHSAPGGLSSSLGEKPGWEFSSLVCWSLQV